MTVQWMTWIRCAMVILGEPPTLGTFKMILDCASDVVLVHVISNVIMIIVITCIAIRV